MTKHTPGPLEVMASGMWDNDQGPREWHAIFSEKTGIIGYAMRWEDAEVFAAAPEMLEALRTAQPYLKNYLPAIERIVAAAIAKAGAATVTDTLSTFKLYYDGKHVASVRASQHYTANMVRGAAIAQYERMHEPSEDLGVTRRELQVAKVVRQDGDQLVEVL